MNVLMVLLLAGAAVCFGLAAFGVASRVNLIASGLLLWVLTALVPELQGL